MSVRSQKTMVLADFQGKRTTSNLAEMANNYLLRADGVMRTGDGPLITAPTPTPLFVANAADGNINSLYDFQRSVDAAHFLVYHQNGASHAYLKAVPVPGFSPERILADTYPYLEPWQFVQNNFILYGTDGQTSYRFIDNAGTLTTDTWGIQQPAAAPTVALGTSGSNSLVNGRTYVYAYVRKYTDSLGITRVSVGPASAISAYSGPTTSQNVAVGVVGIPFSTITNIWVFETFDAPDGTQPNYYFAAELTNAFQAFEDGLPDAALDQSRQAPFDNFPAPLNALALAMYQNRVVAVGADFVQFSADGETSLGIDQESFPPSLFIQIPSGAQRPNSAIVLSSGNPATEACWIGNDDGWFPVSSIAVGSITLGDKITTPGTVCPYTAALTPTHMMWVGPDLRVWAWNGIPSYLGSIPALTMDISEAVWEALPGTVGMDSITPALFGLNALNFLKWYSKGSFHFLVMGMNATQAGTPLDTTASSVNWLSIWQIEIKGAQIASIRQHDIYPQGSDGLINVIANFEYNGLPMLIGGGGAVSTGSTVFNMLGTYGTASQPRISTTWLHDESGADCRWLFVDIETDQYQPEQKFTVLAVAVESPDMSATTLNVRQIPDPRASAVTLRAFAAFSRARGRLLREVSSAGSSVPDWQHSSEAQQN